MQIKKPTIKSLEKSLAMANDALEAALSISPETDNNFFPNGMSGSYTDRNTWDRQKVFSEALRAWRVNPIARRIVRLTRSFILGKGLTINSDDDATQKFLRDWWTDPLNQFKKNIKRWVDENTRTGNLFFLVTVQANGMTNIRAVPAEQIYEIVSKENDIEQEIRYNKDSTGTEFYEAYDKAKDQTQFMLHYAINQPVGSTWGEGDLSPVLVWIGRFSTWLEDRVRLNHFRSVFMYVVQGNFTNNEEKLKRQKYLNANPPKSGTVLVTDVSEQWGIMNANLDAFDASVDGMAIKKMIAAGVGFPIHYLAEPEGSTQTTAEAAGTPTFRTLEETQDELFDMLISMAEVAVQVKASKDQTVKPGSKITITGPDITERDNATLALALGRAYPNLADLFDRDGIEAKEFLRLTYKQFAEVWTGKTPDIKKKPLIKPDTRASSNNELLPKDYPTDEKEPSSKLNEQSAMTFINVEKDSALSDAFAKLAMSVKEQSVPIVNVTNQVETPSVTVQNNVPGQEQPIVNITNQVETPSVTVQNNVPGQEQPIVNITNQVETPSVTVKNNVPLQKQPIVHIQPAHIIVKAPDVKIENKIEVPEHDESMIVERDREGRATKIKKTFRKKADE